MHQKTVKTQIPSSKGKLSAVIHYPTKETEKLAILCPGYLDSKDYPHLVSLAENLAKEGYTVVRFDPTGTWESEGDISDYTNTQYLKDIKNVLEYMLKRRSYTYILLGGHSRGGQVAILYAARDQRVSQVIAIMPSSYRTMMGKRYTDWKEKGVSISYRDLPEDKNKKMYFKVPFSHVEDRERYDVIAEAKRVKVPVIFIAGENDTICLPQDVKEIFENCHQPKRFLVIKGIDHDYRYKKSAIKLVNKKILELLRNF